MKRISFSLGAITFVAALAIAATGAFFSDTETSSGNTFTAGAIDLQIDNTSYVTNNAGVLVASPNNTWTLSDLTNQLFFSFADLKPGDVGEDTISVHAGSNDAWACMAATLTSTPDNGINDPESSAGDATDGVLGGELQNFLNFYFWNDDGDNVLESGETQITQLSGPASTIFNGNWLPLADSENGPAIPGNSTKYIGKAWCFGTLTAAPVAQDGVNTSGPLVRGTGVTCNGAGDNNIAQTDGISVDVSFQAIQARNNGQFLCSSLPPFTGGTAPIVVGSDDLETVLANAPVSGKWYWYDDTANVLNNTLGSFGAGPGTPPLGTGSAHVTLADGTSRVLLTNSGFGGTPLANINALSFSEYSDGSVGGANEAPFLRFNVDFSGSAAYQNSLVYVPSNNGAITKNTWQTWNLAQPGSLWLYSGANWPAPNAQAGTIPKTWAQILADYPTIRMHPSFPQVGMRVGEPGPAGYIAGLDNFSITIGGVTKKYDFGN